MKIFVVSIMYPVGNGLGSTMLIVMSATSDSAYNLGVNHCNEHVINLDRDATICVYQIQDHCVKEAAEYLGMH